MQQRCSRWMKKIKKKNKKMISVDEKPPENIKIKRIVKKNFSKEKKNSDTMMFEIVNVKNLNTKIFIKYHIDDTTTISSSFTKFFFESENFLKKESAAQTHEKKQKKKKNSKKKTRTKISRKRKRRRQINEFLFLFNIYINRF